MKTSPTPPNGPSGRPSLLLSLILVLLVFPAGLSASYPRLFVSSAEMNAAVANYQANPAAYASLLPGLSAPVMTSTPVPFTEGVTAQANSMTLAWIAVAYRYTGNAAYLQRLRDWIPTMNAYQPPVMGSIGSGDGLNAGHILLGFSIIYDVLEGQGVDDVVTAAEGVLERTATRLHTDLTGMVSYPYEQNHLVIPLCGLSVASVVLDGVATDAPTWATFTDTMLARSYAAIAHDGWYFEGLGYWNFTFSFTTLQALAHDRYRATNLLAAAPFAAIPEYLAHLTLPNPDFAFDFADWGPQPDSIGYDWSWHSYPTKVRLVPARALLRVRGTDPLIAHLIEKLAPQSWSMDALEMIFQLLWQSPPPALPNVMTDSFESYAPGTTPAQPWNSVTVGGTNTIAVETDTANRLGGTVDNRVLHIADTSSGLTRADLFARTPATVLTVSFDFYEVAGINGTPLRVSLGGSSASQTAFQVALNGGSPGSYTLNAPHRLHFVGNTSAASVTYNNGLTSLGSLKCDVWIDGVRVVAGGGLYSGSTFVAGTPLAALRLTTDSGGLSQEVYLDNVRVEAGATYVAATSSPAVTPVAFTEAPYRNFDDMGVVHWRSVWNDPQATAIAFKSGPPAGHHYADLLPLFADWKPSLGHAHPDAGSFILYAGGAFLANDTGYTGKKETADHNGILIDGVGQHQGGTAWGTFNGKPYADYNQITMEDVWLASDVVAGSANYRAAYVDSLQMSEVRRDLILVAGRFLLVRDKLASAVAHEYEWVLHTDHQAVGTGAGRFLMQNGAVALAIRPLGTVAPTHNEPTVVETATSYPTQSRLQQRGYHLAFSSPSTASFEFLTAFSVLRAGQAESGFVAQTIDNACVEFADESYTCRVWTGPNADFSGRFAYVLMDAGGTIVAAGMSGQSLHYANLTLTSATTQQATWRRNAAGEVTVTASQPLDWSLAAPTP